MSGDGRAKDKMRPLQRTGTPIDDLRRRKIEGGRKLAERLNVWPIGSAGQMTFVLGAPIFSLQKDAARSLKGHNGGCRCGVSQFAPWRNSPWANLLTLETIFAGKGLKATFESPCSWRGFRTVLARDPLNGTGRGAAHRHPDERDVGTVQQRGAGQRAAALPQKCQDLSECA